MAPGATATSSPATAASTVATRPRPALSIFRLVMAVPTPCQVPLSFALRRAQCTEGAKEVFLRIAPFGSFATGPVSCRHLIPVIQAGKGPSVTRPPVRGTMLAGHSHASAPGGARPTRQGAGFTDAA